MEEYIPAIIWLGIFVALIFAEAQTAALTSIWFIPGAIVSLILAICGVDIWIQIVVFFALGTLLLVLTKTVFKNKFKKKNKTVHTNADSLIGQTAVVTEKIDNINYQGAAKIRGQEWTARMENDSETAEPDQLVTIIRIDGCKLICKKVNK